MRMRISKKAILGTFTVFALILGLITFIFVSQSYGSKGENRVIGTTQLELMSFAEKGESAMLYIDESAKMAAAQAGNELAKNGGYYNETPHETYLGFSVWDYRTSQLPTDILGNFSSYMDIFLDRYLARYSDIYIPPDNYDYWYSQGRLKGFAGSDLVVTGQGTGTGVGSPSDDNNKIVQAVENEDLGNMARKYATLYSGLPYVWGGESPYTYDVSLSDQKDNPNSIFKGVSLEKYQPAGNSRSGEPTVPGFDCSGLFWWIFRHAGIIDQRLTAEGYYELAQAEWQKVCLKDECTKDFMSSPFNVQQGDVLFIDPCTSGVCHIAVYTGDSQIVESAGGTGVIMRKIPESYYPGGSVGIVAIYRPVLGKIATLNKPASTQAVYDIPSHPQEISYSVRPSFTIDTDFSPDTYKTLREDGFNLYKAIFQCQSKGCVQQQLTKLGLGWSLDCGGEDLAYYDLVEQLDQCSKSADENCVCSVDLSKKDGYAEEEYEIGLEKKDSKTGFIFDKHNILVDAPVLVATSYAKGEPHVTTAAVPMEEGNVVIQLEYGSKGLNKAELQIPGPVDAWPFGRDFQLGSSAKVYKSPAGLAFIDIDDFNDEKNDYRSLPSCNIPEERIYRFCAPSDRKMLVFDNGQLTYSKIQYRFAIKVGD